MNKKDKEMAKELFQRLYLEEGLEDIKVLHHVKKEALERWCKEKGRKLCAIVFALALDGDIEYILEKLTGAIIEKTNR